MVGFPHIGLAAGRAGLRPGQNADTAWAYEDLPNSCRSGDAPMSAAEPARPGPDRALTATVIPLIRSTANRPQRRPSRRERPHVPPQPASDLTPHEKLAATVEDLFAKHGRSLTDPESAEDYLITLRLVRTMLQGARQEGVISEEAHADLDAMMEGMMSAPGLLA